MKIPIVSLRQPNVADQQVRQCEILAQEIISQRAELDWQRDGFSDHIIREEIGQFPTLHLDDLSEVPLIESDASSAIFEQSARLRAGDGDWVAQSRRVEAGVSDYYEHLLEFGRVNWLYPNTEDNDARKIASACWDDQKLRQDLENSVTENGLRYIHPDVSTRHVWELAGLLQRSTRQPIQVIGPTPAVSKWANSNIEFANAAKRLLGQNRFTVRHSENASDIGLLTKIISRLSETRQQLSIKFSYETGGDGHFLVDSKIIGGLKLEQTQSYLVDLLNQNCCPKNGRVQVDVWDANVISSLSVQIWIPPLSFGDPVVEGLFEQVFPKKKGQFVGTHPVDFPSDIEQAITNDSFLLAYLFQNMGYVGRCSFDLVLAGKDLSDCRIEFIGCNARWNRTSTAMTLMNRLGISEQNKTYCAARIGVSDAWQLEFKELKQILDGQLYQPRTRQGNFVLLSPTGIAQQSSVEAIAVAESLPVADRLLLSHLPSRLDSLVQPLNANGTEPMGRDKTTWTEAGGGERACRP